jgi:two-component system response regulator DctR
MRAGALSFVTKPYREQELLDSINEALARDAAARSAAKEGSRYAASLDALTEREREVLDLAVTGLPSKVIAQQLGISYRTVELHRSRVLEKLSVGSMVELIRIAAERRS